LAKERILKLIKFYILDILIMSRRQVFFTDLEPAEVFDNYKYPLVI